MTNANGNASQIPPATDLLASWRGGRARLWDYSPSHSTLTLRVERRGQPGNLHIVCGGLRHVTGPNSWDGCALRVEAITEDGECLQVVNDDTAGFALQCKIVSCLENVEPVYSLRTGSVPAA